VAIVFVLRAFFPDTSPLVEQRLHSLPIRIGRNPLADFQLRHAFVSDFHALIEDLGGRLYVRDLNSKNGVYVCAEGERRPTRIQAQEPVDLAHGGFQLFLSAVIRVSIEFEHATTPLSARASTVTGSVLGNRAMLAGQGDPRAGSAPPPPLVAASPHAQWRSPSQPPARWDPNSGLPFTPAHGDAPEPLPPLPGSGGFEPAPAPRGRAAELSAQNLAHTGVLNLSLEAMALQGLRELAGSLAPGKALATTGDLARFITRLHDTIEVFCRCFVPLREGYAQFVSSLDLQKAAMQRSMMRSTSYVAVEGARDPAALAAALLDWRDRSLDAPKAIEGIFADLMIHQVALLDGVMQGVRGLLEQISPDLIEQQRAPQGALTLDRSKARYKALWEAYCALYEELAEEKQAFAHIFGTKFTEVYREYRRQRQE
jgi:type VI secretion system protein ImpI